MNYYDARPLEDGTGWHYTCHNRRLGTWAVGYCADHPPHATEREARACYRSYLLAERTTLDGRMVGQQRRCLVCNEWTDRYAEVDPPAAPLALCDLHRTADEVGRRLGEIGTIICSW